MYHRRKIFVSYKYYDFSVKRIDGIDTPRGYVNYLQKTQLKKYNINKAEKDNTDNGDLSEDYLKQKLANLIWDSTITVILISPGMKSSKPEKCQWIPREISYSLRTQFKYTSQMRSHPNALIAVVLPQDVLGDPYSYYLKPETYFTNNTGIKTATQIKTNKTFQIIKNNMFNKKNPNRSRVLFRGLNSTYYDYVYSPDSSYIETVKWKDFCLRPSYYYKIALNRQKHIDDYYIQKQI